MLRTAALLSHWEHNLNPFILRIWGEFGIRWYGVSYLVGILLGVWLIARWRKAGRVPLLPGEASEFVFVVAIGMMIGGRLGYCLLYTPTEFFTHPWMVFNLTRGGMASHGGMLGIVAGLYYYARRNGRNFLVLSDALAVAAPMGVIAGRIANFINGELWGRPSNVPWAVIFPRSVPLGAEHLAVPRHPSQLYAAFLEGVVVLAVGLWVHARHRRPGLSAGTVLVTYSFARFIDEFWREPDEGYALWFGWMSKGQAYTFPVLALGTYLIVRALRRPPQPEAYLPPQEEESAEREVGSGKQKRRTGGGKRDAG